MNLSFKHLLKYFQKLNRCTQLCGVKEKADWLLNHLNELNKIPNKKNMLWAAYSLSYKLINWRNVKNCD